MKQPEQLTGHISLLGEGPVWDGTTNTIFWVDILQGRIHACNVETGEYRVIETGQMIGSLAIRKGGGLVAALQHGFAKIDLQTGAIDIISDPEKHLSLNRFNDGKCDPAGRFWAGTMPMSGERSNGSLYLLEADGSVSQKLYGLRCPNGLAWSPDQQTLYFIDTHELRVVSYDYEVLTGNILNEQVVLTFPDDGSCPDGMTIDAEGMLWIAFWNGWKVERWDPLNATLLQRIEMPVALVTSCTFGGANLNDLYITSAKTGLKDEDLARQPLAGSLFVIRDCGYTGVPAWKFAG